MYISISVKPACVIPLRVSARMANVIYLQDLQLYNGQLYADKYSRIFAVRDISSKTADEKFTFAVDGTLFSSISCLQPVLGQLRKSSRVHELVTVAGCVTHVDEETAFAWPACGKCDNDLLCEVDESIYLCQSCSGPAQVYTKMSLEVFISCPGLPHHYQIRVKLQQSSISSLLPSTQNDGKGYEMSSVLNKDVGPLHCVVLKARTIPFKNGEEESMQFTLQEIPSWECKLQLQLQEINEMFLED
ncbi:DNA repair-scaffolding protein-like [Anabrus simplex]|uniref:DNA repair-scaffolding protein-like n=1 Tax=Anabrus simplex TaxID=316456 RepID=UPI0035A39CCF